MSANVYLITGDDAGLISEELSKLMASLCGDDFVPVEEHGSDSEELDDIGGVLDALSTPPFLSDKRLVVLRGANKLDASQVAQLVAWVKEPVESNILILTVSAVGTTKSVPAALSKVVKASGQVLDTSPGMGRQRNDWIMQHIRASGVRLDAEATRALVEHLGDEVARLGQILELLEAAYGQATKVGLDELVPYLGDTGSVPPWDLTDALDKGNGDLAVAALHRMMQAGGRHPLSILASLHKHYSAMLRLDGAGIRSPEEAASLLKMSAFPAKKVLEQGRRLGYDRIVRAVELLADADANLRGLIGWPGELVMEVLVARLAQLARATAAPATAQGSRR